MLNDCVAYYINLEHDIERNEKIVIELKKIFKNDDICRFEAVKHNVGQIGCALSHINVLKNAMLQEKNNIFIFEDDVMWTHNTEYIINILNNIDVDDYNMIMLYYNIGFCENVLSLKHYKKSLYHVANGRSTAGYIIKKAYIPKLLEIWEKSLPNIMKKPGTEIDRTWCKLQTPEEKFYCIIPRLMKIKSCYSNIIKKISDPGGYCVAMLISSNIDNIADCFQYEHCNNLLTDDEIYNYVFNKYENLDYVCVIKNMNFKINIVNLYKLYGYIVFGKIDYAYDNTPPNIYFIGKNRGNNKCIKKISSSVIFEK
jgi:GR25 family glycosyltransferase involved in LPS biosynthesis